MKLEELNELIDKDSDNDGIDDDEIEFACKKSKSSCRINKIKSFLFGGFSSRFWILRKHINSMQIEDLDDLPFFSWQCISLELKNRCIDLVIKDQTKMNLLLRYLIYTLRTVNGFRNSAEEIIKQVYREESDVKKKVKFAKLDEDTQ